MIGGLNFLAVITSALISLGISFVWFTILFRDPYIAGLARTQAQMDAGPTIVVASIYQFAGFVVLAAGLAWVMQRTGWISLADGMALALICWAAFFAATVGPMYAYQAFPLSFFGIVAGGYLVVFLATGAILGAWR